MAVPMAEGTNTVPDARPMVNVVAVAVGEGKFVRERALELGRKGRLLWRRFVQGLGRVGAHAH